MTFKNRNHDNNHREKIPSAMNRNNRTDTMLQGSIVRPILAFAIPVFWGNLFQQMYNLVDTIIVGKSLGTLALAGVGSTTGLSFFTISLCNGLCNGFAVSAAQKYGANDKEELRKYFGNAILLVSTLVTLLTLAAVLACKPILMMTKTPDNIFTYAYRYIFIILLGFPCTAFYNFLAAHLRAIGNSRTPVIALVISSVINIGLDLLFILVFHLDTLGAAAATVIAQFISGGYLLYYIRVKVPDLHITRQELKISSDISKMQLSTAFPMALQGIVISFGILIVQTATNGMGALYVAGSTAGNKLYGIMSAPIDALCQAMVPFSGQNYGAGNYERIHKGLKKVMTMTWTVTTLLVLIAWLAGPLIMTLFVDAGEVEVIRYGHQFLLYFVMGYGFLSIQMGFCNTLQGMGFAKYTVPSGILECVGRMVGAMLLTRILGYTGICLALPLAWVFTSLYIVPVYFGCRRKLLSGINQHTNLA